MDGWTGVILRVDLDRSIASQEVLGGDELRKCIGGRGLASYLLTKEVDATVDALGSANKLIFAPGALTGTAAPGASRCVVASKSPVTGGIACADIGGFWPAELKLAGYDALIIEGKAASPVYLSISGDNVEIRPADHLWGKGTKQVAGLVCKETADDASVVAIGPAGERSSGVASIVEANKRWSSGRAGLGAVMGAKKLKAIAVKGSRSVKVADRDGFQSKARGLNGVIKSQSLLSFLLPFFGTAGLVKVLNSRDALPTNNFQGVAFGDAAALSGETMADSLLRRRASCFACPVACGRVTELKNARGEGPELEDILALGTNCGVGDLNSVVAASYLCEDLGVDPVAAGGAIACAMEMRAKGILGEDKAGLRIAFGDGACVQELIGLMAQRRGLGELMADGGFSLAKEYGTPELFMGVKKQALSGCDPGKDELLALSYATSNTGVATTADGSMMRALLSPAGSGADNGSGTAQRMKLQQDSVVAAQSVGFCPLIAPALDLREVADLVGAATGQELSVSNLLAAGERTWEIERGFNLRAGISAADDRLPDRFQQPSDQVEAYYEIRGWDSRGNPKAGR